MDLACYENVTGFAREFEISPDEWRDFSGSKVPDGVIRITREGLSYELAIEVETSRKNWNRTDQFFEKYREAFSRGAICSGVIVVCDSTGMAGRFSDKLKKFDREVAERFLVIMGSDLCQLNPKLYGEFKLYPGFTPENARTVFGGLVQYSPMKSARTLERAVLYPPDRGGQTLNQRIRRELKPIST